MGNVLTINKLLFSTFYKWQNISCVGVMLLNLLISIAVIHLTNVTGPAGAGDVIVFINILVIGLLFSTPTFKYTLSQGVTRKDFYFAAATSLVALAAAFAAVIVAIFAINLKVANIIMVYTSMYSDTSYLGLFVWEFTALLFFGMMGWFICMVYYRSRRPVQIILSLAPFIVIPLIMLFNALVDGAIVRALWDLLKLAFGFSGTGSNPYIGAGSLLVVSAVLAACIFLLIRRAPVKE
jgi:hypothetical protein